MDFSEIRTDFINGFLPEEDEILKKLVRETSLTQIHPRMMSGWYQGNLLSFLIKLSGAKSVLEIGTFSGYAAICMARALPEESTFISIEYNDEIEWLFLKYFKLAGIEHKIDSRIGDAKEIIPQLENEFDFVFIDGNKREYIEYIEAVLPKVKQGGLILADNVLWDNKIFQPVVSNDFMTKGIIKFNDFIRKETRVEKLLLPLRDGLMLMRKL